MTGRGHCAITILNATATGRGCSLAIDADIRADWQWGGKGLAIEGAPDDALAKAIHKRLGRDEGASVRVEADLPPSRGCKTSSAAAAAMIRSARPAATQHEVIAIAVDASIDAGVTLTGAFDDQVASVIGGCHLTDNAAREVLELIPAGPWHAAVWVPDEGIPKRRLRSLDASVLAKALEAAEEALRDGDIAAAMRRNHAAFFPFYQAAGLPVREAPVAAALEAGAWTAGLTGTGPAVAALADDAIHPEPVAGGTWRSFRVVQ